jgi:hypothetical protein
VQIHHAPSETVLSTCSLEHALSYWNEDILHRFNGMFGTSLEEAREIFEETKKWLWVSSLPHAPQLVVTSEMLILDEMWHNFILFTHEYTEYCQSRFGRYLHHAPTTRSQTELAAREYETDPKGALQRQAALIRQQRAFLFDELGETTVVRWYAEYPLRYGRRFFLRAAKAHAPDALTPATRRKLRALVRDASRSA